MTDNVLPPTPETLPRRTERRGASGSFPPRSPASLAALILLLVAALVLWLLFLGRSVVCPCGIVRFWQGAVTPAENSQQFSDWYSLLHMIFGTGLFALVDRLKPHWRIGQRLLVAVAGSVLWEAVENTPVVIALFNEPSDPLRYRGDSVLNSLSDTLFVALGFALASRLPGWAVLALALATEAAVWLAIDDGLILGSLRMLGIGI